MQGLMISSDEVLTYSQEMKALENEVQSIF